MTKLRNCALKALWAINDHEHPKQRGPNPHVDMEAIQILIDLGLIAKRTIAELNAIYPWHFEFTKYRVTEKGHSVLQKDAGQSLRWDLYVQQYYWYRLLRRLDPAYYKKILLARQKERISPTREDFSGVVDAFMARAKECEEAGFAMAI